MKCFSLIIFLLAGFTCAQHDKEITNLAQEFFEWRAITQPCSGDDIPRVERPDKWIPDYSPRSVENYQAKYKDFKVKLNSLSKNGWSRSDSIDYLLLHSAIERVNWELNVLRLQNINPDFYIQQTLGAVFELLVIHTPITKSRAENIILRFNSIPNTIESAKENLTDPVLPFADIALEHLLNIKERLYAVRDELNKLFPVELNAQLNNSVELAAEALEGYAAWIEVNKNRMLPSFNVGREYYEYFLKNVALLPYTPEELLLMGRQEWDRSVAFDVYEKEKNKNVPRLEIFSSGQEQINSQKAGELAIRKFLEDKNIMSIPSWLNHYNFIMLPDYLAPIADIGVNDDLTSETRLDEDAIRYIVEPSLKLSYFSLATAKDTRPITIHEGVPGHYFQLAISWANENPIRRRYFDSGSNEGIAFYVEELLLQYGLFDDSPRTREIIYSFMRLRALRVDVDINLAVGNYTIEQAGKYLSETVPMDFDTGIHEAGFFSYNPGQAITYQIGKLQILKLISDAKVLLEDKFDLKKYHDYMMKNGNVPIALQRWEYLGLKDEIEKLWPQN